MESTGAGFISDSECMEDVKSLYKDLEFKEAYSRNKGFLVVGKLDSSGTYLVRINITTKTIYFGVVCRDRMEDFKEDYPEEEPKIIKKSYNYEQLKYSELDDFTKILTKNKFVIFESDPDTVLECFYSMGLEALC